MYNGTFARSSERKRERSSGKVIEWLAAGHVFQRMYQTSYGRFHFVSVIFVFGKIPAARKEVPPQLGGLAAPETRKSDDSIQVTHASQEDNC